MIIEGVAGVLGVTSLAGSIGVAAFLLATFIPAVGSAFAVLTITGGLHTWLTRKSAI